MIWCYGSKVKYIYNFTLILSCKRLFHPLPAPLSQFKVLTMRSSIWGNREETRRPYLLVKILWCCPWKFAMHHFHWRRPWNPRAQSTRRTSPVTNTKGIFTSMQMPLFQNGNPATCPGSFREVKATNAIMLDNTQTCAKIDACGRIKLIISLIWWQRSAALKACLDKLVV